MLRRPDRLGHFIRYAAGAALFLVAGAGAEHGVARARDAGPPPAASGKTDVAASKPPSIKENVKKLGQEITDPSTPSRIKGHEQELEKKIESTRDRQRKDHGRAKPGDAVDLAKSLDSTGADGGGNPKGEAKAKAKPDAKAKADGKVKTDSKTTTPPPAAAKTAPTP